jgi:hypothetical protein
VNATIDDLAYVLATGLQSPVITTQASTALMMRGSTVQALGATSIEVLTAECHNNRRVRGIAELLGNTHVRDR